MRLRNAWFQKLIPDHAISSSDAVIGFDTSSWILAKRAKNAGRPFILERTAIHRSTRAQIRARSSAFAAGVKAAGAQAVDAQDKLESEEVALASKVVVASEFSACSVRDAGVPREKIAVIPYGVDWPWFANSQTIAESSGKLVFLFVGLLKEEKGIQVLIEAWKRLAAPEAELWLVGSGEPHVVDAASRVPGVHVRGKLSSQELRQTYQSASVFVFPTYYDGFAMVLLEAMASGLPVLATPHCAAPELVHGGEAGAIFPADDPDALRAAMAAVCANRAAWAGKGAAAKEIAKSYSWENYGKRWATLLREVAG